VNKLNFSIPEGVLVAPKDYSLKKHKETNVPNLWVVKLLTSFKSKGFVKEKFNWQWFYWYLTNEGIEFLRDYLNLPPEIVPATLKKPKTAPRAFAPRYGGGGDRPPRGEGGFRPRGPPGDQDKVAGAGGDFVPRFVRVLLFPQYFSIPPRCWLMGCPQMRKWRANPLGSSILQSGREGGRGRDTYRREGGDDRPRGGPRPGFGRGGGAPRE